MDQDFKSELSQMEHRLTEMEEKIDGIDSKLTQVIDAILGNRLTKTGGFMNDIEVLKEKIVTLEKKQEKDDEFKKRLVWTVSIVVAIGVAIQYFLDLYSHVK
jgi:predicted  nucleic acid-binding Zn-ribbon protein